MVRVVKLISLCLWPNGRHNALNIEPDLLVKLQIYTGDVTINVTQSLDVAGMIGAGEDEIAQSVALGLSVCNRLPHCR
jgi:hypothetical protein